MKRLAPLSAVAVLALGCIACAGPVTSGSPPPSSSAAPTPATTRVDPGQAERLQRIMAPLIRVMDQEACMSCRTENSSVDGDLRARG
jgi:hypothetical protein